MTLMPSKLLGHAVFVAIIIFGLMEAFRQLNFAYGSRMMAEILTLLGSVIFGAVIIAAAIAIAKLVSTVVRASGGAILDRLLASDTPPCLDFRDAYTLAVEIAG